MVGRPGADHRTAAVSRAAAATPLPEPLGGVFPEHLFRIPGDPAAIRAAADAYRARGLHAGDVLEQIRASSCPSWTGAEGEQYRQRLLDHTLTPTRAASTFTSIAQTLSQHASSLGARQAELARLRAHADELWPTIRVAVTPTIEWQHCLGRARLIAAQADEEARTVAMKIAGAPRPDIPLVSSDTVLDIAVRKVTDPKEWRKAFNLGVNDDLPDLGPIPLPFGLGEVRNPLGIALPAGGLTANVLAVANIRNDAIARMQLLTKTGGNRIGWEVNPERLAAERRLGTMAERYGRGMRTLDRVLARPLAFALDTRPALPSWMRAPVDSLLKRQAVAAQKIGPRMAKIENFAERLAAKPVNAPLARVSGVANKAAPWLGALTSGLEQWKKDGDNPAIPAEDRVARAATRGAVVGGAGFGGGEIGAVIGGAIGSVALPGLGTAAGAAAGAIIGGAVATWAADSAVDKGMQHWDENIRRRPASPPPRPATPTPRPSAAPPPTGNPPGSGDSPAPAPSAQASPTPAPR